MYTKKILSVLIILFATSLANAQFPSHKKGGLLGINGAYEKQYNKYDPTGYNTKNTGVGINPSMVFYGKTNRSFSIGLNLNTSQSIGIVRNPYDTMISKTNSLSSAAYVEWSNWISIGNSNQFFITTGPQVVATNYYYRNKVTSNFYPSENTNRTYKFGVNYRIGLAYIRNAHWIWQLNYTLASVYASYNHPNNNNNQSGLDAMQVGASAFNSGVGFSLSYLFGNKKA